MKKYVLLLQSFLWATLNCVNAQTYTFSQFTEPYVDLVDSTSITNGITWSDSEFEIPIGFDFTIYNNVSDSVYLDGGGVALILDAADLELCYNLSGQVVGIIQEPSYLVGIAGADVLQDRGWPNTSVSPQSYVIDGVTGNRVLKIELNNFGFGNELEEAGSMPSYMNMQIWLYESDCSIEFRFGESDIVNPLYVYNGNSGGIVGVRHQVCFFVTDQSVYLSGDPANPSAILNQEEAFLNGTPASNTVYRFERANGCVLWPVGFDEELNKEENLYSYPNPTSSQIHIEFGTLTNLTMNVFSPLGTLVDTRQLTSVQSLDYELPETNGIYFIQFIDADGSTQSLKVVKE